MSEWQRQRGLAAVRGAAGRLTRRASVAALGGAAVAAVSAAPPAAEGGDGKKAKKKCKKQVPPCLDFAEELCGLFIPPSPDLDACIADAKACCTNLKRCQGGLFFDCALAVVAELVPN